MIEEEKTEQDQEVEVPDPDEVESEVSTPDEVNTEVSITDEVEVSESEEELLLPQDDLLSAGIHIGTRMKTKDIEPFIYRVRPDGLFVLDVKKTDERIRTAAKFLARFDPPKIAVVAGRLYARYPAKKFCELTKTTPIVGRFTPGLLSNPLYTKHIEPEVLIVSDPKADAQAINEASVMGIPVVALCSTDNESNGVDLIIPTNNKGRRALAVIFWLLTRQVLRERGELSPDQELDLQIDDFEAKISRTD